ncbi:protein-glutamate O-methyltransferase CheR [Chlorogloeopsis sp. ULAP01]|uniref:CheR family methyltransferase n=1 Tax=Chlorogloeopsis sp. ULAP01 TaxID=3056483 RepID=UPI0025AB56CD|nr:protein-glutamate O-methyltransferase CheR [Chlorogloeopsis sp. ULAP01]MDM9384844.1 protein-glutamate O-methyltransferase CheR [Chlorogloeopsis sp. ULAP01]
MKQATGVSIPDFNYLRQLVQDHSAVVLYADKTYLAELHLQPIAESTGFASITDLIAYLRTQPFSSLHIQVIEALVTNETSFFRDIYPFEALRRFVLPELVKTRAIERSLNIWCAACSNGQEPYSIAMLIREHFPMLASWSVRLIASDFSNKVLARARQGIYNQLEIQRGLPKSLRDRYFEKQECEWQIKDEIRQIVEFHQINLVQPWPSLPNIDVIFLRNALIYFDLATKKHLLKQVKQQLRPDGYLFLGSGETTINLDESFERVQLDKSIYYRLHNKI